MSDTSDIATLTKICMANLDDLTTPLILAEAYDDAGDGDRAELIRLQCLLCGLPACKFPDIDDGLRCDQTARSYSISCRACNGRVREKELIGNHPEWRPKCIACDGNGWTEWPSEDGGSPTFNCKVCNKNGRVGSFHRGLLHSVPVRDFDVVMRQFRVSGGHPDSHYEWRRTILATALIDNLPTVRSIVPADKVPVHHNDLGDRWGYWWEPGLRFDEPHQIPFPIGDVGEKANIWKSAFHGGMMVYVPIDSQPRGRGWATPELAISALGLATYQFLKSLPA